MRKATHIAALLVAVSTLAATAGYFFGRPATVAPPATEALPTADATTRLLALTLPDLNGQPQSLTQWKGKVLVVNFWATWCPPCKEEMPEFSRLHVKYAGKGIQFVGISIDTADKVLAYQQEARMSYPLLISNLEVLGLSSDLGNRARALPFTVVLRPDGRPQQVKLGKFSTPDLELALNAALLPR